MRDQVVPTPEIVEDILEVFSWNDELEEDLKRCYGYLEQTHQELDIQTSLIDALYSKISRLERQSKARLGDLQGQILLLSQELTDAELRQHAQDQDNESLRQHVQELEQENGLLYERNHAQTLEIQRWKCDPMSMGREVVSRCWQAGVDEQVRREREKDRPVIEGLRYQNKMFQAIITMLGDANGLLRSKVAKSNCDCDLAARKKPQSLLDKSLWADVMLRSGKLPKAEKLGW